MAQILPFYLCGLLFIILFPTSLFASQGEEAATIILTEQKDRFTAKGHISYLEDPERNYSFDDIQTKLNTGDFKYAGQKSPNFGLTNSAYWFYLSLKNLHPSQSQWWLKLNDSLLDNISIYIVDDAGNVQHKKMGDHYPLDERQIKTKAPMLKLDIPYNKINKIFIRIQTFSSVSAPINIWNPQAYPAHNSFVHLIFGIFYGGIIVLLIYNFKIFLSIRDLSYLYYCGFVGFNTAYLFCYDGFSYEYLWPNNGAINLPVSLITSNLSAILLLQFARSFLRGKTTFPKFDQAMIILMLIGPTSLILFTLGKESEAVIVNTLITALSVLIILIAGIVAWIKGLREAKYYLIAWVPLVIGIIIFDLRMNGLVVTNFFTAHSILMGSLLESILLSFALAYRMEILKEENIKIQQLAKSTLAKRVKKRTLELKITMKKLAKANDILKENSHKDGLTGVRNRAYFEKHFNFEWLRCRREKKSLSILMLDIDHFKNINDTFGHLCGDHALIVLSNTMAKLINRPGDIIARYGGEEFVIILPETNIEGAKFIAERIRRDLEAQSIKFNDHTFSITVSIGCASMIPTIDDEDPDTLISIADRSLYIAKENGRNRIYANAAIQI